MLSFNFFQFPVITTSRLTLRQLRYSDDADLLVMRSDASIMQFIPRPLATSLADARELITAINHGIELNESITWAITLTEEDKVIGTIGFVRTKPEHHRAEIGYLLHKQFQGKGIMQEALEAIVHYGFSEMRLHTIEAVVSPGNSPSITLLKRNHFIQEAYFKEREFYNGKFIDSMVFTLWTPEKE